MIPLASDRFAVADHETALGRLCAVVTVGFALCWAAVMNRYATPALGRMFRTRPQLPHRRRLALRHPLHRINKPLQGRRAHAGGQHRRITEQSLPTAGAWQALARTLGVSRRFSGDVGNRMIGERQVGMPGPTCDAGRRTALGGERRP